MNSYRALFTGPVGDSEMNIPCFISSGLDETDYVELFAPKPWLIVSTIGDFFTPEGARQIYDEARRWYGIYGGVDRVDWALGPGPHGTPQPIRERIYEWMIRWLKDGRGDPKEEPVEMEPAHRLIASASGQVSFDFGSREIYEVIRERYKGRRSRETAGSKQLLAEISQITQPVRDAALEIRQIRESREIDYIAQTMSVETEPGIELPATLFVPRAAGRKPGVLIVEGGLTPSALAVEAVRRGAVVLSLTPRGLPYRDERRPYAGDYLANTRAWLIGRNLAAMRAYDIRRGVELLSSRPDVEACGIRCVARREPGVWLLLAAAGDQRIARIWLDRTPYSLRAALDEPLNRNLHTAIIPGFCLKWDLCDLVTAMQDRTVIWSDPTNWMGIVKPLQGNYRYRATGDGDAPFLTELLK